MIRYVGPDNMHVDKGCKAASYFFTCPEPSHRLSEPEEDLKRGSASFKGWSLQRLELVAAGTVDVAYDLS